MITRTQMYLLSKLTERLQQRIYVAPSGCWIWKGTYNRNGYGRYCILGKQPMAHIHVYKILHGDYQEGLLLDHNCRTRNCCNPTHISPVTPKVNTHRGKAVLFKKKRR